MGKEAGGRGEETGDFVGRAGVLERPNAIFPHVSGKKKIHKHRMESVFGAILAVKRNMSGPSTEAAWEDRARSGGVRGPRNTRTGSRLGDQASDGTYQDPTKDR